MTEAYRRAYEAVALDSSRGPLRRSVEHILAYQTQLLSGVRLANAAVLDIGGGRGDISFRVGSEGARLVVCLEPIAAGADRSVEETFTKWQAMLGHSVNVTLVRERLEEYSPGQQFDVVVMNNVINHLDEAACATLHRERASWDTYLRAAAKISSLVAPGGALIVADCSRRNLFGDLRLPNPMAPSIEWGIHQDPKLWREIFEGCGLKATDLRWDPPPQLGWLGRRLLSNRLGAYVTTSHFIAMFRSSAGA